jgi:nitrogen-specific signal transduction histidine kinase
MLNAQMLGEYEDMPVNEKQKLYQAISSNSERVADIVKKLLSFARANEKKKSLEYIGFIVEEALSLVKYQINKSGAILDVDIPDSLPKVLINKQQLQQVFLNIINNSRYSLNQKQYVHGEKMRLEIKGDLAERSNTQYVRLTFHDNGE